MNCGQCFLSVFFVCVYEMERMAFKYQDTNVNLGPSDSLLHRQSFRLMACTLGVRMS